MSRTPDTPRPPRGADRCPGVLRPHQAVDGALLRLRTPGGRVPGRALAGLSALSRRYADGDLKVTSRANLQMRGLAVGAAGEVAADLVSQVTALGLLPSAPHERVRNVVASPFAGLVGGLADVRPVVAALDSAICANPLLARLPGRFLLVVDDGRGDVSGLRADLTLRALDRDRGRVVLGAGVGGPEVPLAAAAEVLADLAERFVRTRDDEWHVADLPHGGRELLADPAATSGATTGATTGATGAAPDPVPGPVPHGVLGQDDGRAAVSATVPLGVLVPGHVDALVEAAADSPPAGPGRSGNLVLTPWRGVVVPDLAEDAAHRHAERMAAAGLVLDGGSPWTAITACTGAPGCRHAAADTAAVAREIAHRHETGSGPRSTLPVHVVACERRCGTPSGAHTLVMAGAEDRPGEAPEHWRAP